MFDLERLIFDLKIKKSKLLPEPSCSVFSLSVANLLSSKSESIVPFTLITCESYNIGSVTHLDYNPR